MVLQAVATLLMAWAATTASVLGAQTGGPHRIGEEVQLRSLFGDASPASLESVRFRLEEGLPSLSISSLVQAPDGLLWVGTGSGCVTFDGYRFRPIGPERDRLYDHDVADAPEVTRVTAMLLDEGGQVWVADRSGLILRYETESSLPMSIATEQTAITCMMRDSGGRVWVGGSRVERSGLRGEEARLTTLLAGEQPNGLSVVSIVQEPAVSTGPGAPVGEMAPVYIATNVGLYRWSEAAGMEHLDSRTRHAVFFDSSGHRWELLNDGQFLVDGELGPRWPEPLGGVLAMEALPDGKTLLSFADTLIVHEPRTGQIHGVRTNGSTGALLAESCGGLWVAAEPMGLQFFARRDFEVVRMGIPRAHADTLALVGPATLLVGSHSLSRPRLFDCTVTPVHKAEQQEIEFPSLLDGINGAAIGGDGIRYVATGRGVIRLEDLMAGRGRMSAFEGRAVRLIIAGPDGGVWAGMRDGLYEVRDGQATGRGFTAFGGEFMALGCAEDAVVAAIGGRVLRFTPTTMEATELVDLGRPTVRCLFHDPGGDLWISTYGSGLYRLHGGQEGGELDHWSVHEGLPDRFLGWVGAVPGATASSHLWVNSNRGVFAVSRASLQAASGDGNFQVECWLKETSEANGASGVALPSGQLVVPTMAGVSAIDTNEPLEHSAPPRLSLSMIWANGSVHDPSSQLVGPTDLDFQFEAASFPRARGATVQYRLEGHDTDWRNAGEDRTARYVNLSPGSYRFHLRGRTLGALSGPTIQTASIEILPHWHERTELRLTALLLLVAGAGMIVYQMLASARAQSRALELEVASERRITALRRQLSEAEENERARIARELHDDFAQRLAAVALGIEALSVRSGPKEREGPFVEAVASIQSSIRGLAHDLHGVSRRLHPTVLDDRGLASALRSECAQRAERVPITIDFTHDGSADGLKGEVGLALFRMVQEALQNASTHARATRILVSIVTEDGNLSLTVEDDGCGLSSTARDGPGIGLASMSERVQLVGGTFQVGPSAGGGTAVRAWIPGAILKGTSSTPHPNGRKHDAV